MLGSRLGAREGYWTGWATVYSDASYWHGNAGIAYYIRFTGGKVIDAEQVDAIDPLHAELLGIMNGVARAIKEAAEINHDLSGFFVRSDCLFALKILQGRKDPECEEHEMVRSYFEYLSETYQFNYVHIRAHQGEINQQARLNELCDQLARTVRKAGPVGVADRVLCDLR